MNITKKVLSFLTASVCTVGFFSGSLSVSAEYESDWMSADDFYYTYVDEDEDGNYDFVRIIGGEAETITIPETVDDLVVKEVNGGLMSANIEVSENNPYFCTIDGVLFDASATKLVAYPTARTDTSYTVPDTVTEIGNAAFYDSDLVEIILPESLVSIGNSAFGYNRNLVGIAIPDTVEYIGDEAFTYCETITEVNLPQGLASIGSEAFYCCYSLETITIPDTVTSIGSYAFSHTAITEIILPQSLTEMSYGLFSQCENLTDIAIPDTVTTIGEHAFAGTAITEITLPSSLTAISNGLFDECWLLTDITIPDTVTEIGDYAFYGCSALSDIEIPDSVTSVGEKAFYNTPLIEIQEDKLLYYVDSWLVYFDDYYTADTISIVDGTVGIADNVFNSSSIVGIEIPEGVKYIGDLAFAESSISYVALPETLVSIGEYAFSECEAMTEIAIPDSVTEIGEYAFYNCGALNTAVLSSNLTAIRSNTFAYCDSLTEINIPESVTEIGEYAFYYCDALENIVINNPECEIYDGYETISNWNNGTIYGYINSTAYTYARAYEWNFEWLDENIVYGDANLDGALNIRDSAYLTKSLAEGTVSEYDLYADYNRDESVNVRDAAAVANNVASELLTKKGGEKIQREDNPSASISIGSVEAEPGEYIEVPVTVNAKDNLESVTLLIEWSEELGELYSFNGADNGASVADRDYDNSCAIAAYGSAALADGTIATLSFYVPYNVKPGTYEIYCTAIDTFALYQGEDLASSASVTSGSVTVYPELPEHFVVKEGETTEIPSEYDMFTAVSEDNTVAKVVGNVIQGIHAGETVIKFVTESGKTFESTAAVMPTEKIEVCVDEQKYVNVPLYYTRWLIEDESVAYISSSGVLTGLSEGTTKIYAINSSSGKTIYVGNVTVKEKAVTTAVTTKPTTTTATTFKTVAVTSVEVAQKDHVDADMPTPSIYLSKVSGKPGETVTVYVKVKCNNNFEMVDACVSWDDEDMVSSTAYGCNGVSVASANGDGYCTVVAYGSAAIADGAVAAIDFTIPADAPAGKEYKIYFSNIYSFCEFNVDDYGSSVDAFSGSVKTGTMVSEELVLNEGQSIGLTGNSSKYEIISQNQSIARVENNILYGVSAGETYLYFMKDKKTFAVPVTVTIGESCVIDIYDSKDLEFVYDGELVWLSENISIAEVSSYSGYFYANNPGTVKIYALDSATGKRVYECNITVVGEPAVTTSTSSTVTTTTTTTTVSRGTALISLTTGTTPAPVTAPADHVDADMPNPSVYISNAGGEAGETVKVDVKVKCNNNLGTVSGAIYWWYGYGLKLKSVTPASEDITIDSVIDNDSCLCNLTATSNVEGFKDGTIATLEFEIPADAELGNSWDIIFDYVEYMSEYGSEESLSEWSSYGGSITVTGYYDYDNTPAPPYEITVEEGYTIMFSDDFKDFEVFVDDYNLEEKDGNVVSAVYNGYSSIYLVNDVINYIIDVKINPDTPPAEITVRENEYEDIDVSISDYNYTWLSDNQEVAWVDSEGWVYGVTIGTANIYAVDKETGEIVYKGKVTVTEGVAETTAVTSGSPTVTTVTTVSTVVDGTGTPGTENPSDGLRGDANLDGKVNVRDAAAVAGALAKNTTDKLPQLADYNEDGKINVRDAAAIAGYLASLKK